MGNLRNLRLVQLVNEAAGVRSPDSNEPEQSVLGALMLDGAALRKVPELGVRHFALPLHRQIFQAILDCAEDDGAIDLIIVADRLGRNGAPDAETVAYLGALAQNTPSALNIRRYAELVREHAQRRDLIALAAEVAERAPRADPAELRAEIVSRLSRLEVPASTTPIRWDQLAGKDAPARQWAVTGWLGFDHITLLVGTGGIGKTLLAQQLASCLVLGQAFIDEVPAARRVLFWACEDDHDELWRRQVAIAAWLGVGLEAFADRLRIYPRHGEPNALVVAEGGSLRLTALVEDLRLQAQDAEVVILDNVAQLFGANENDRHAVTSFLNALAGALPGKAILLLAHPARAAGSEFSGSSAWENVARTRLYLGSQLPGEKPDTGEPTADDQRFLSRRKANYSTRDWRRLHFRDGVLVPEALDTRGGLAGEIRARNAERVVLEGLRTLASKGVDVTDGRTSPRYLPRVLEEYKLADSFRQGELAEAMRALVLAGRLRKGQVGRRANRSPKEGLMEVA
ncbi:MAG: AAA family ATPase [Burkholderiales bacterium]|nr:AAA family ATPase [Burkholderiales bacterium]